MSEDPNSSRFVVPLDQVQVAHPGDPILDDDKDVDDETDDGRTGSSTDPSPAGRRRFAPPRGPHMRDSGGIVP